MDFDQERLNRITGLVIEAAIKVHRSLGPGLLESAYEACLLYELRLRGLAVESQVAQPIAYEAVILDIGYRVDLVVENCVFVELKAIEKTLPIHYLQLLSYLRLSKKRIGLLINFHGDRLVDGVTRVVNDF